MKFIGPESLSTLENSLARNNEKIKAVVLFGTDVYDKILIMKALRPYFPGAFFCTSDLDALFLSSQDLKWTRNLVVVSGFGFTLQKELQGHILSFRSSRQTAQYFATLAALNASIDELQSIDEKNQVITITGSRRGCSKSAEQEQSTSRPIARGRKENCPSPLDRKSSSWKTFTPKDRSGTGTVPRNLRGSSCFYFFWQA